MQAVAEPRPTEAYEVPRTDQWLTHELDRIWESFFQDVPRVNPVTVCFARQWKNRLGLITLCEDEGVTYIRLNGLLRLPAIPDFVNTATIAHELVHYAHGFGSPLPRKYDHPHQGGIVPRELVNRGLGFEHRIHVQWISDHWHKLWASMHGLRRLR